MAQQTINVGSTPNDGTGDQLRSAMIKVQNNFSELYGNVTLGFSGNVAVGNTPSSNDRLLVYSVLSNTTGSNTATGQFISIPISNAAVSTTTDVRALRILVASNSQFKNASVSNTSVLYGISSIVNNGDSSSGGDAKATTAVGIDARVQNYANGVTSNTINNAYVSNFILQQSPTSGAITNGIGVRSVILNNGNATSITAPVLFSGLISNTALTNAYGVWISGENFNYLSGNTGIGTASPNAKLQVSGTANISGAVAMANTLSVTGAVTFSTNTLTMGYSNVGAANFANGATRLPNGLLMQFGQLLVNTTTAAQTFSTVTGTAFTNIFSMTATSNSTAALVGVTALSATGFTLISNTTANVAVYWTAIGK